MKLKNKLELGSTLKVGAIPTASASNFSVLFENEGLVNKRIVGNIINSNVTDFIQGISVSFPSIFNYNTSITPSDANLVVSLKNQLAGTVFAAPTTLNGTPSFRKLTDSDLSETSIFNQLGNYVTLDTEQDITGKKTFSSLYHKIGTNPAYVEFDFESYPGEAAFRIFSNYGNQSTQMQYEAYPEGVGFMSFFRTNDNITVSPFTLYTKRVGLTQFTLRSGTNAEVFKISGDTTNTTNWFFQMPNANMKFALGYWSNNVAFDIEDVKMAVKGGIYSSSNVFANGFKKHDSSNDHVLLGQGGHKLISDFALSTDIPDVSNFVTNTRTITAGNGLTGGGNLTANRTITLGTPSSVGLTSTNSVTTSSHTHALDAATTTAINNGQTAFGWGNHALVGYLTTTALNNYYQSGDVNIPAKGGDYVVFPETGSGQLANFDFDTITTTGFYNKLFNAGAASTYNAPKTGYYGHVEVSNHGGNILQITRPYRVSDGMWMRNRFSGNWTPWVEFIHSGNLSSYANSLLTDFVPTSRTITINGVTQNLSANRTWTVPDTITRLRGTSSGTYTSGDLTLLAGANTTITQSGSNITIASTNTNTTYSAGTGLSLTGTTFGQTITTSGTGTFVTGITQTTNGFQVNLGTPPNTTYSAGSGLTLSGTTFSLPITYSGTGDYVSAITQTTNGLTVTRSTLPTFNDAITSISRNGVNIPISNKNVDIPIFSTTGAGLVPPRVGSVATKYLREDGTWVTPTNTTYSAGTLALLQAGTNTTNRVWSPKVIADYVTSVVPSIDDSLYIKKGTNNVDSTGQPFSIDANNGRLIWGEYGRLRYEEYGDQDAYFEFAPDEGSSLNVGNNWGATEYETGSYNRNRILYTGDTGYGYFSNQLRSNSQGNSRIRFPITTIPGQISEERYITVGAKVGDVNYYADEYGMLDLPSSDGILSYSTQGGIIVTDWNSFALSDKSISLGSGTVTSGNYATSVGSMLSTSGFGSVNQGYSNSITKALGYAVGAYNSVRATLSGVLGIGLINRNDGAFVVGRYNAELPVVPYDTTEHHTQAVFAIGAGRDETDRFTALTVYGDGRADYAHGYDDSTWTDNTLVTKKWVQDNAGGGGGGVEYINVHTPGTYDLSVAYVPSLAESVYNVKNERSVVFRGGDEVFHNGYKVTIMTNSDRTNVTLDSSGFVKFIDAEDASVPNVEGYNSITFIYDKEYSSFRVYHKSFISVH